MPADRSRAALAALAVTSLLGVVAWARWPGLVVGAGFTTPDAPLAVLDREITEEFGLARPVVFLIVARDGDIWTRAGLTTVAAVTRDVLAMPGVVATDVVSIASPNMRDVRFADGGLEPTYLMGEVPPDDAAIAVLRRRVDEDQNYGGNLVSRDGAAALVAANFLPGAADAAIAAAALAVRTRHDDAATRVEVVGAPVLMPLANAAAGRVAVQLALAVVLGAIVLVLGLGVRTAAVAASAAVLCIAWTAAVLVVSGAIDLPWSAYGVAAAAVCAAAVAVIRGPLHVATPLRWWPPLVIAALALGLLARDPTRALGLGLAAGLAMSVPAGLVARLVLGRAPTAAVAVAPAPTSTGLRIACLVAIALCWLGNARLHASFGLAGYGERFLPGEARGGLDAMRRHFPPPSIFVVRLRGEPGFVTDPAVLEAMDDVARRLRTEPRVRSVQSLADIVKLVNRSFNDDDPEFFRIPADRGLVVRYLTLAYSPGFRRFVDRSMSRAALWVYADGDDPAGLGRVYARLAAALEEHPIPGVEVDPIAGDGALALGMSHLGWDIALRTALAAAVLVTTAALAGGNPLRIAVDVVAGVSGALLVGAGLAGWLGLALDLVMLPILACVALLGGACALFARDPQSLRPLAALATALASAALPLAVGSFGAAHALVPLLVAPLAAVASLVTLGER